EVGQDAADHHACKEAAHPAAAAAPAPEEAAEQEQEQEQAEDATDAAAAALPGRRRHVRHAGESDLVLRRGDLRHPRADVLQAGAELVLAERRPRLVADLADQAVR